MYKVWDDFIPDDMKNLYQKCGFGGRMGLGQSPAILLLDLIYGLLGDSSMPLEKAMEQYKTSCGEYGWAVIPNVVKLLSIAREKGIPVIYAVAKRENIDLKLWVEKRQQTVMKICTTGTKATEVVSEVAPKEDDIIVIKKTPNAFVGNPLANYLTRLRIDSLIIAGGPVSSCVLNTTLAAFQHNYHVAVMEDGVFDRHPFCRAVTLFEIDSKWADVITLKEVIHYIESLPFREKKNEYQE